MSSYLYMEQQQPLEYMSSIHSSSGPPAVTCWSSKSRFCVSVIIFSLLLVALLQLKTYISCEKRCSKDDVVFPGWVGGGGSCSRLGQVSKKKKRRWRRSRRRQNKQEKNRFSSSHTRLQTLPNHVDFLFFPLP